MIKKLVIYSLFLFEITICVIYQSYGTTKIPDLRWKKTLCVPTYGAWTNLYNDAVLYDFLLSPYHPNETCWVSGSDIIFSQPYFDNVIILEMYLIMICLNILLK